MQRLIGGLEEAPNAARGLADALLVLDQRQAYVIVAVLAETDAWHAYDFPSWIRMGRYRGQRQKWFAMRFVGDESEINVTHPDGMAHAEFDAWRWEPLANIPRLIVPFKRSVYERVASEFSRFAA